MNEPVFLSMYEWECHRWLAPIADKVDFDIKSPRYRWHAVSGEQNYRFSSSYKDALKIIKYLEEKAPDCDFLFRLKRKVGEMVEIKVSTGFCINCLLKLMKYFDFKIEGSKFICSVQTGRRMVNYIADHPSEFPDRPEYTEFIKELIEGVKGEDFIVF